MSSDVASVVNGLIETAKDGEQGFRTAAEKVKQSDLKTLFSKYATQRAAYARELQAAVSELGEKPADHGHVTGSLHRGWINLKEALSKNEDKAIIDEAEAGEDAAKKAYAEALEKALPANIRALVEKQNAGVLEAHNTVSNLKHSLQHKAAV
jgi:uncharacterized protein (TIGR02284 family)